MILKINSKQVKTIKNDNLNNVWNTMIIIDPYCSCIQIIQFKFSLMEMQRIQESSFENSKLQVKDYPTNKVIFEKQGPKEFYYLPCYLRFKVKSIENIEIQNLTGTVSGVLLMSVYYGDLDKKLVDQFLSVKKIGDDHQSFSFIAVQFTRDETIIINSDVGVTIKHEEKEKRFEITIRRSFVCQMEGELFLSPFEVLNFYVSATIQTVHLNPENNDNRRIAIRFNTMNTEKYKKIDHSDDCSFGQYSLIKSKLEAKYTNSANVPFGQSLKRSIKKAEQQQKQRLLKENTESTLDLAGHQSGHTGNKLINDKPIKTSPKYFQYAHFRIPLYKHPSSSLATVFLPLWLLGILTLAVFFQGPGLGNALQNLGTLMLAFVAFIPTIHQQIPAFPTLLVIEILVYLETSTCFLALLRMFLMKDEDSTVFVYLWRQDGLFIAALILNILNVVAVLTLIIIHKVIWEPAYNVAFEGIKDQSFIRETWGNEDCDAQFAKFKEIKPLLGPLRETSKDKKLEKEQGNKETY